jgi:uncharacterized protein (TIGR02147 family)
MIHRPDKPSLFNYRQPQVYLADLISWYKGRGISLRNLARKLNVSPALLSLITKGKRQITEDNVDVWALYFEWNSQEVKWLKKIIMLEFATTAEKREALDSMTRNRSFSEKSPEEVLTYKYLRDWWNVAIREMSALPDFQEEEGWIQERLLYRISVEDIRKSLKFLNKHKLLVKYNNFRRLDCQGDIYKLSLTNFHEQILSKASESIYKVPSDKRHILGHTLVLSKDQLPELKDILDEALERITKLAKKADKSKEVYHVALAGFPLTEEK